VIGQPAHRRLCFVRIAEAELADVRILTQPALDYGFVTGIIVRNVIAGMVQLEAESKKQEEKVQ
jgi:hypothetical protein